MTRIPVTLPNGSRLLLIKEWIEKDEAKALFASLRASIPWESREVVLAGKRMPQPRLVAWIGQPGLVYVYSGSTNITTPWTADLLRLRHRAEAECSEGTEFNSVFANLYRNERDSIGYHADDEPIFGKNPTIASLSLGCPRRFKIQSKATRETREMILDNGDLVIMSGTFQEHYLHAIPKEGKRCGERINLTYRRVVWQPGQTS